MKYVKNFVERYIRSGGIFIIVFLLIVTVSIFLGISAFKVLKHNVVINDEGNKLEVVTLKNTVNDLLKQHKIEIFDYDYINHSLNTDIGKQNISEIKIKRAVPVSVQYDGTQKQFMTYMPTVDDFISNSEIELFNLDKVEGVNFDTPITGGLEFKVVRVIENEVTQEDQIPYREVARENPKMLNGEKRVIREGENGSVEKTFKYVLEDGVKVAKELVAENIIKNPISKIVEYGTLLTYKTARGDVLRYSDSMRMRATSYTASFEDTGKHPGHPEFGITYTGTRARVGVIAVDPRVIPLGSKVYVEMLGDIPDYGFATAEDIGSAIKGDLIDLYFDNSDDVRRWGVKNVNVYILDQ